MQRLILTVQEESGIERRAWPVTRGVPLPQGAVAECADLSCVPAPCALP